MVWRKGDAIAVAGLAHRDGDFPAWNCCESHRVKWLISIHSDAFSAEKYLGFEGNKGLGKGLDLKVSKEIPEKEQ